MVADPAATPVTTPVVASTVAAAVLLLLQLPPPVPLLVNVAVLPAHNADAPLTLPAAGNAFTVTVVDIDDCPQPEPDVTIYVIVAEPAATPVTTPVDAFTVAADVLLLLQVPPLLPLLVKAVVEPTQTDGVPPIVPAFGSGLTVIGYEALLVPQLVVTVYIMDVDPPATPVTMPEASTEAMLVLLLLHVPPELVLLKIMVALTHTDVAPLIVPALSPGFTAIVAWAVAMPHPDEDTV